MSLDSEVHTHTTRDKLVIESNVNVIPGVTGVLLVLTVTDMRGNTTVQIIECLRLLISYSYNGKKVEDYL